MAEYKKSDLKTKIETDLADNDRGSITAKTIRNSMVHIVDSIEPIVASGTDAYFRYALDIKDSGVTLANTSLNKINSHWDNAVVSTIEFVSGNDTTYKEDGGIDFYTSSSGVSLAGVGRQKRLSIKPEGQLHVYASGVNPPLRIDRAHPSSGVAIFTHNTPNNLASTSGISIGIGHYDTRTKYFQKRIVVDKDGNTGLGIDAPLEPVHIRASGHALRLDLEHASNNSADIIVSKYKGAEAKTQNTLLSSFGLGIDTNASGVGRFFVGFDSNRDGVVNFSENVLVIASGGNASFGSSYPKENLVVGDDIGKQTSSADDTALVVGSLGGNSKLFIGSGNSTANLSPYGVATWDKTNKQLSFETRSSQITRPKQLVLDSTNGYVGFAASGTAPDIWRPLFNAHVYASGTAKIGIENPMTSESAIYVGRDTAGSGDFAIGNWSAFGYKSASNVLKINNAGNLTSNHLTVDTNGVVGINTDSPYSSFSNGNNKLHVHGNDSSLLVGDLATYSAIRLLGSVNDNTSYVQAGTSAADTDAKIAISRMDTASTNVSEFKVYSDKTTYYGNIALNDKWVSNDGGNEGIRVTDDGKVGINVAAPTHELQLATNSAAKPSSTLWTVVSDERVKTDITTISGALEKIDSLRPVSFKYTQDYADCHHSGNIDSETEYHNFLAQEVGTVFPSAVKNTGVDVCDMMTEAVLVEDLKTLDSHIINVYLVAAVQELKAELDAAKARITELES